MMTKEEGFDSDLLSIPFEDHKFEDFSTISLCPTFTDLGFIQNVLDEDTLDVAETEKPYDIFSPVTHYGRPDRTVFGGKYNFEVQVNSQSTHKKKYLYSNKLNRIYVDMNVNFSLEFAWGPPGAGGTDVTGDTGAGGLLVRATVVFADDAHAETRVERCLQHRHARGSDGCDPLSQHVLRSAREPNSPGVHYCGNPNRPDSWYSVLVDVTSPTNTNPTSTSPTAVSHAFQFVCKNSCSSGINRRSIEIIFTLEDVAGTVLGRRTVGARVCACPRRDMVRDEDELAASGRGKRRVASGGGDAPGGKKVKMENVETEDTVYTLPAGIQIVGSKTLTTGLTVMKNMMEQIASCKRNDPQAQEKINKAIAGLKNILDQFK